MKARHNTARRPARTSPSSRTPTSRCHCGRRTFELDAIDGGTRFRIREEFTGLLEPLIRRTMPDLRPSLQQFAMGLAKRVEERNGSGGASDEDGAPGTEGFSG